MLGSSSAPSCHGEGGCGLIPGTTRWDKMNHKCVNSEVLCHNVPDGGGYISDWLPPGQDRGFPEGECLQIGIVALGDEQVFILVNMDLTSSTLWSVATSKKPAAGNGTEWRPMVWGCEIGKTQFCAGQSSSLARLFTNLRTYWKLGGRWGAAVEPCLWTN